MDTYSECPYCERKPRTGILGNSLYFKVYRCKECKCEYCSKCGGDECPECGSEKRSVAGECWS